MFDDQVKAAIAEIAQQHRVEPEALMAVVKVESNGCSGTRIKGKLEPLIRFEGHYFYRLLPQRKRNLAVTKGLASSKPGAVRNPLRQKARWKLLERAKQVDRDAALCSVSWGVGQVMGDHWRWLGYASIDALVVEARSGLEGQIRLMMRYVDKAGLVSKLQRHDWAGFARAYNGPGFARNAYDRKMRDAYFKLKGTRPPLPAPNALALLSLGSYGHAVSTLQRSLSMIGYSVRVDGDFGATTEDAVRSFQVANGLPEDGIAGPRFLEAIQRRLPPIIL